MPLAAKFVSATSDMISSSFHYFHRPMIVAMIAVRMVQVAVHEIIDVITVRHRFMAAVGAMHVVLRVPLALVLRRAIAGIRLRHFKNVLFDLLALGVMHVAVV